MRIEALTKPELISHLAEVVSDQENRVAELRRQRVALIAVVAILATMATF